MRSFSFNNRTQSLLSMWVESVNYWLKQYSTFPVRTYKMDDLANYFTQRMTRDDCGIQGISLGHNAFFLLVNVLIICRDCALL